MRHLAGAAHKVQLAILRKLPYSARMNESIAEYKSPGQLITALLASKGWTKRVLAIVLGIDETSVNRLTSDKRPVTAEMSILLEELFGTPAEDFLSLQKSYDLAMARITSRPDPKRATRASIFGGLPISEMIKRGWIQAEDVRDVSVVEAELVKFFGVNSSEEIQILPHAAKKTDAFSDTTLVQLAWLHRVRTIASEMLVPKYSPSNIKAVLTQLKAILPVPEETRKIPRILAECGIRFVIVECLPSAKIDGACLWLDDASPVIGMSLRHDRIDNFWFVLRHELEHVICQHGKVSPILDTSLEGDRAGSGDGIPEEERVANFAASEFCVSQKLMDGFIARKSPYFAERDILGFAKTIGVHPGLIAGQLQYRTNRYDRFRSHLVKVRSFVTPSAMVDGWGDVAPVGI